MSGLLSRVGARRVSTETVLQLEACECGAASLSIVLSYFGKRLPLEELRSACGVSRDGSKASSILRAARAYGLQAKGLKAEPEHLEKLNLPMIAFVDFCHFLVIEGINGKRVYLNDPASGKRSVSREEFSDMFTGVVLTFSKGEGFQKSNTRRSIAASLWSRTKGFRGSIIFVFLISLSLVLPGLVVPILSRIFVDQILIQKLDDWFVPLLIGMSLTAGLRFILNLTLGWALTRSETQFAIRGTRELFSHILRLPIFFFGTRYTGEIADRLHVNDALAGLLTGDVARAVLSLITAVIFLSLIAVFSLQIAIVVAVLNLANLLMLALVSRRLTDQYQKIAIDQGKLAGIGMAGLQNIETIKASGAESSFFNRWSGLNASIINTMQSAGASAIWAGAFPSLVGFLTSSAVLLFGGLAIMRGELTVGSLVALQSLAASFSGPVATLTGLAVSVQDLKSHTRRIEDIVQHKVDDAPHAGDLHQSHHARPVGAVTLANVGFGYFPLEPPLISGLSLSIKPGSQLALVGASGSGKSTIGRVIAGLYKPAEGEVLFDGRPKEEWSKLSLASAISYVDQEIILFEGTVRDNLTLWDRTVPETALSAAAHDAMIHDVISTRPGAYESIVEEDGRNFSGGQRQRLEIARALAQNPRILILDEATSSLDPITEACLMANLRRRGITLIIIAHRLSTIRDSDEIIFLEHGKPIERGTHDDLMEQSGRYSALIES